MKPPYPLLTRLLIHDTKQNDENPTGQQLRPALSLCFIVHHYDDDRIRIGRYQFGVVRTLSYRALSISMDIHAG